MLPKNRQAHNNTVTMYGLAMLAVFILSLFTLPAYAATFDPSAVNAETMLGKIAEQIPQLMRMVTAISYVMGMYFIIYGIFKLKQYGEQRTMMSSEHSLKGPLVYLIVGTLLLYLPSSVQIGMTSFWTEPNPYGYLTASEDAQWTKFLSNCFMVVQLFGVIAFMRGLVILSQLSGHGQPGTFGRGITHIIGGILCINIYQFVQVILATLGLTISS